MYLMDEKKSMTLHVDTCFLLNYDTDVINRNMYEAYYILKVLFLKENEMSSSLSFSLQTFVQKWEKIYECHESMGMGNMECSNIRSNLL